MRDYPDVPYVRYARLVNRIEVLETALREIASPGWLPRAEDFMHVVDIARAALEGKK